MVQTVCPFVLESPIFIKWLNIPTSQLLIIKFHWLAKYEQVEIKEETDMSLGLQDDSTETNSIGDFSEVGFIWIDSSSLGMDI